MNLDLLPAAARSWRKAAIGARFGRVEVQDAELHLDGDADGALAVFLDLTLSDPPEGMGTWPVDDVLSLHRELDNRARALHFGMPWHVRLRAVSDEEPDDGDPDEDGSA